MVILKQITEQFIFTLKKFLKKMGLNANKFLTGKEAKEKLQTDELRKNSKLDLTDKEIQFLLHKLRQANYTGAEFETFYVIVTKLSRLLPQK